MVVTAASSVSALVLRSLELSVESEPGACRQQGAIPRRLASRRSEEQASSRSPSRMIPRMKERIKRESLEERLSRAAEQELRDYLATGGDILPGEDVMGGAPSSERAPGSRGRAEPEGQEPEAKFREPDLPSQHVLRFLPVPVRTTPPVSMEWDREEEEPYAINEGAAAAESGAPPGRHQSGEKERKRKKRVKPYNPRRHLEADVSRTVTPRDQRRGLRVRRVGVSLW